MCWVHARPRSEWPGVKACPLLTRHALRGTLVLCLFQSCHFCIVSGVGAVLGECSWDPVFSGRVSVLGCVRLGPCSQGKGQGLVPTPLWAGNASHSLLSTPPSWHPVCDPVLFSGPRPPRLSVSVSFMACAPMHFCALSDSFLGFDFLSGPGLARALLHFIAAPISMEGPPACIAWHLIDHPRVCAPGALCSVCELCTAMRLPPRVSCLPVCVCF